MDRYCVDCGKEFSLDRNEIDWYQARGWALPKRCKCCRGKKKEIDVQGIMVREITTPSAAKAGSLSPSGAYKLHGKPPGGACKHISQQPRSVYSKPPINFSVDQRLWFVGKTNGILSFATFVSAENGRLYLKFSDGVWSISQNDVGKRVFLTKQAALSHQKDAMPSKEKGTKSDD